LVGQTAVALECFRYPHQRHHSSPSTSLSPHAYRPGPDLYRQIHIHLQSLLSSLTFIILNIWLPSSPLVNNICHIHLAYPFRSPLLIIPRLPFKFPRFFPTRLSIATNSLTSPRFLGDSVAKNTLGFLPLCSEFPCNFGFAGVGCIGIGT